MQDFLSLRGNIGREKPRLSLVSTITRSSEGLGGELTNYLLTTRYSQTSHDFSNIVYFTRLLDRDQDQSRSPKMTRRPDVGSSSRTEMESAQPEIRRPAPVLHPENSCCFCLTLRSGTAIISILHSIFYLGLIIWSVRYLHPIDIQNTTALAKSVAFICLLLSSLYSMAATPNFKALS